jgi:hypothetical protein
MVKLTIVFGTTLICGALAGCANMGGSLLDAKGFREVDVFTTPAADLSTVGTLRPDGVLEVSGKPSGFFATRDSYANYRLHAEWRWPGKPGNAGVLLHVASGPKDGVWPVSLQVQTKHGFAGDVLPMAGAGFSEFLTTVPGAYPAIKAHTGPDSEKPVGEWNSLDVLCQDGAIEVSINNVVQNRVTGTTPREGRIGFQLEGTPYELRHVTITRLP